MSGSKRRFADSGLVTAGMVLLVTGGLCTGGFIASLYLPKPQYLAGPFSQLALLIGALPVLAGLVMILVGARPQKPPPPGDAS